MFEDEWDPKPQIQVLQKEELDRTVVTNGRSAYSRSTNRKNEKTPVISFPRMPEESSVTHEIIHHMKAIDIDRTGFAKTAYPIDKKRSNQVR